MSLYKIQGKAEKLKGIYYEFDSEDKPLGEGGMGKVYKGRCIDEITGRSKNVAIKFMFNDLPPYAIEKARREASIHFRHDNLVEMLGFIETEGKTYLGETQHFYHVVSELLEGVSLDNLLSGRLTDQHGNFVPYAEKLFKDYQQDPCHFAVEIAKNLLSGLMAMHDAGYIHRDIDPTNIMITSDGHIKLIDFGIAKKMNSLTAHDKHLTQAGQFVGKPEYAAPELVLGAINEQNQTTDIYAVGILLFQCIVGHVPFEGDRSDILQKQLHSKLPLKLIKNHHLRKIVARATDKSRANRFQSAAEFRVALDRVDLSAERGYAWKPLYGYLIAVAVVVPVAIFGVLHLKSSSSDGMNAQEVESIEPSSETSSSDVMASLSYESALDALKQTSTQREGLMMLEMLSEQGDASATYLLSRLYFKSKKANDYCPDSISVLQKELQLPVDNIKAHNLLKKAIEQDPDCYLAKYELACDYWGNRERTEAVEKRDITLAAKYFNEAKALAEKANDEDCVQKINDYLGKIQVQLKNKNDSEKQKRK